MCSCGTAVSLKPENNQGSRVQQSMQKRIWSSSLPDSAVEGVSRRKRPLSAQGSIKAEFLKLDPMKDETDFLEKVRRVVSENRGQTVFLTGQKYSFKIRPIEDTPYDKETFDDWEQSYLPDHMFMEVIGVVTIDSAELVLMVCEDGNVYGYEEEDGDLHLVADSLKDLLNHGVTFPGNKQYYSGQRFEDMTEDEWDNVKKSDKVLEMMEQHSNMVMERTPAYLENLDCIQKYEQKRLSAVKMDWV